MNTCFFSTPPRKFEKFILPLASYTLSYSEFLANARNDDMKYSFWISLQDSGCSDTEKRKIFFLNKTATEFVGRNFNPSNEDNGRFNVNSFSIEKRSVNANRHPANSGKLIYRIRPAEHVGARLNN